MGDALRCTGSGSIEYDQDRDPQDPAGPDRGQHQMSAQRVGTRRYGANPACSFCTPDRNVVLTSTARFRLLLATGAIVDGHSVIVPVVHAPSMTDAGFAEAGAELLRLRVATTALCSAVYGEQTVFFEHGASCKHDVQYLFCAHGHLHALPVSLSAEQVDMMVEELWRTLRNHSEMAEDEVADWYDSGRTGEYFYFAARGQHHVFYPDASAHPAPRLFRQLFAQVLELDPDRVVNWETQPDSADLAAAANLLRARLLHISKLDELDDELTE